MLKEFFNFEGEHGPKNAANPYIMLHFLMYSYIESIAFTDTLWSSCIVSYSRHVHIDISLRQIILSVMIKNFSGSRSWGN